MPPRQFPWRRLLPTSDYLKMCAAELKSWLLAFKGNGLGYRTPLSGIMSNTFAASFRSGKLKMGSTCWTTSTGQFRPYDLSITNAGSGSRLFENYFSATETKY